MFSKLSALAVVALAAIPMAKATTMTSYSGTSCDQGDVVNWSGHSSECTAMANVKSLMVHDIDGGCSVTYYSDGSCSQNANIAGPNFCVGYSDGRAIGSFSWDCASAARFKSQL